MELLFGCLYILFYISFLYFLGKSFRLKCQSFSYNILFGFVLYTSIQAAIGIYSQLFNRTYTHYHLIMSIVIIVLIIWGEYRNRSISSFKGRDVFGKIKSHIINNWFVYVVTGILTIISITNVTYQWSGNHLDDGYYLNYISNANQYSGLASINHATGLPIDISFVRLINTFELDAAFWSQLFNISGPIMAKYFLTFINYFLIANGVIALFYLFRFQEKTKKKYIQFFIFPLLFFMYPGEFLVSTNIMPVQDAWQFNTAIWYGSSIVRHLSILLIGVIFLEKDIKINIKLIIGMMTIITLVSRATQAVPIVFIMIFAISMILVYRMVKNNYLKIGVIIFEVLTLLSFNLFIVADLTTINGQIQNITTPVIVGALIVIVISCFRTKNTLRDWNVMLLISSMLVFIPYLNTMFITTAVYDFVIGRTVTLIVFTLLITASVDILFVLISAKKFKKIALYISVTISLLLIVFFAVNIEWIKNKSQSVVGKTQYSISKTILNPNGLPQITQNIGSELQKISTENNKDIAVLSPSWIDYGGVLHSLAIHLRIFAPNTLSISAIPRYPDLLEDNIYYGYNQENQNIFDKFESTGGENFEELKLLFASYPIDYIILTNKSAMESAVSNLGMKLEMQIYDENININAYILQK